MIEPRGLLKKVSRSLTNTEGRIGKVMRLDHNERTTPLPAKIVEEVWKTISPEELVAYPALEGLYAKLAKSLGVSRDMLLLTYGSDTAIRMVFDTYVEPGDEMICLNPSYGMFAVYGEMFGAKKNLVEYNADFYLPVNRITNIINSKTKLVILADPNHTGTAMPQQDIISVIEKAAKAGALVLVDEAYHYFYEKTMIGFINRFDNLIIVRSLSKAFGIAPLRVGYLVSQAGNIQNLYKVKLTHDITSVSAKFTEYLLDHLQVMQEYVKDVNAGKKYLAREFARMGAHVLPSVTNFVFVRLPDGMDAVKLVRGLEARNVCIKGPFKGVPLDGLVRITVGPQKQMSIFMKHLKELAESKNYGRQI